METDSLLVQRLKDPESGIVFDVQSFDSVDSTNDHLKRLAERGAQEGTVIFAGMQTKGHGRYGREWISPKGNLYLSLLLRPKADIRVLPQLSFVVALATGRAVSALLDEPLSLQYKWPNDILINGKKAGGILLESSIAAKTNDRVDWLVIGIGVNMMHYPEHMEMPATSIAEAGGDVIPEIRLLERILRQFDTLYTSWEKEGFTAVREEWLSHAAFKGETIRVRTATEEHVGIFEDINKTGELILTLPGGRKRLVSAGEVFFTR